MCRPAPCAPRWLSTAARRPTSARCSSAPGGCARRCGSAGGRFFSLRALLERVERELCAMEAAAVPVFVDAENSASPSKVAAALASAAGLAPAAGNASEAAEARGTLRYRIIRRADAALRGRRATTTPPSRGSWPSKKGCGALASNPPVTDTNGQSALPARLTPYRATPRRDAVQAFYLMRGGAAAERHEPGCASRRCRNSVPEARLRRRLSAPTRRRSSRRERAARRSRHAATRRRRRTRTSPSRERCRRARSATRLLAPRLLTRAAPPRAGGGGARMERAHASDGGPACARRCAHTRQASE